MRTVEPLTPPALIPITPTGFHISAQGRDAPLFCVATLGQIAKITATLKVVASFPSLQNLVEVSGETAWETARKKKIKGEALHEYICAALKRDPRSDPSWWKRLLANQKSQIKIQK